MNDIDHDGVVAAEAGGADCDDTSPAVAPGLTEVCGDGLDNDCVGGDLPCDTDAPGPGKGGFGDPVDISATGCGCASGGARGGVGAGLALLAAAGLSRRRARA